MAPPPRCWALLALAQGALSLSAALPAPRLRAIEIKRRLRRFGVDAAGIFEKDELLALLRERVPEATGAGHAVPLLQVGAIQGAMGAGVTVDSAKRYWALRLELPEVSSPEAAARMHFVIDSAASNSLVSPAAAAALGAKPTGVTATSDTATASARQAGLQQVGLGAASVFGLPCGELAPVVMDLPVDAGGLLGLDFLSRHDLELFLRPSRPLAIFHRAGAASAGEVEVQGLAKVQGARVYPSGLLGVKVRLRQLPVDGREPPSAGAEVQALLDLGSSNSVCNWAALETCGLKRGDAGVREGDSVLAGASGEPVRVSEAQVELLCAAGAASRRVTLSVADLPIFAAVGLRGPALVLGLDALAPAAGGSRLVLAAGESCVWLEA